MEKIALDQIKTAEVRGALAAFMDAGLLKMAASQEEFDGLVEKVAGKLGDNYDLQKVAAATDEVMAGSGMTKTAAETARNAALGELLLMKTAGQIDNDTFVNTAKELMKLADYGDSFLSGFRPIGKSRGHETGASSFRSQGNVTPEEARAFAEQVKNRNAKANGRGAAAFDAEAAAIAEANKAKQAASVRKHLLSRIGKGALLGTAALGGVAGTGYLAKQLYDKYAA